MLTHHPDAFAPRECGLARTSPGTAVVPAFAGMTGGYILLRAAAAADASTTLSTSSRQRRISIASTG
jgi:hypothetical protein